MGVSKRVILSILAFFLSISIASAQTGPSVETPDNTTVEKAEVPEGVNSEGSFRHRIPFDIPSFRGLEPRLAATYRSSFKGTGSAEVYLGVGWQLSGFSSIERVSEGGGAPTFLDDRDVFRLDGRDLMACFDADSTNLWPVNREYPKRFHTDTKSASCSAGGNMSTQVESYRRIELKTEVYNDQNIDYFVVTNTGGTQYTYKAIGVLAVDTDGPTSTDFEMLFKRKFLLTEIRDAQPDPNIVTITYAFDSKDAGRAHRPAFVRYAGYEIEFQYNELASPLATFSVGHQDRIGFQNKRLASIQVKDGGFKIRAYNFAYVRSPVVQRYLLDNIRAFGSDYQMTDEHVTGGSQLPQPLHGTSYQADGVQMTTQVLTGQSIHRNLRVLDLDQDNRDDLILQDLSDLETNWAAQCGGYSSNDALELSVLGEGPSNRTIQTGGADPIWDRLSNGLETSAGTHYSYHGLLPYSEQTTQHYLLSRKRVFVSVQGGTELSSDSIVLNGVTLSTADLATTLTTAPGYSVTTGNYDNDPEFEVRSQAPNGSAILYDFDGSSWTAQFLTRPRYTPDEPEKIMVDLNGDGIQEELFFYGVQGSGQDLHPELFGKWVSGEWRNGVFRARAIGGDEPKSIRGTLVAKGDLNGDGNVDLILAKNSSWSSSDGLYVRLSTGNGYLAAELWLDSAGSSALQAAYNEGFGGNHTDSVPAISSRDVNGDGLDDILVHAGHPMTTCFDVSGSYFTPFGSRKVRVFLSTGSGIAPETSSSVLTVDNYVGAGDFDGNGLLDFVGEDPTNGTITFNDNSIPNLLVDFTDTLGGETTVSYKASSSVGSNDKVPSISQVVASIERKNGHGQSRLTTFDYSGSKYDYVNRRSLGFKAVTATLPQIEGETTSPVLTTEFHNNSIGEAGNIRNQWLSHEGTDYRHTFNLWWSNSATRGPFRRYLRETRIKTDYDGDFSETKQQFTQDDFGQRTRIINFGFASNGSDLDPTDNIQTRIFFKPNLADYIVDKPYHTRTYAGAYSDRNNWLSRYNFYYDDATLTQSGLTRAPLYGNVTATSMWTGDLSVPHSDMRFIAKAEYDTHGNMVRALDAKDNQTLYEYDPVKHLFQTKVTDAEMHFAETVWNEGCQGPELQTDVNQLDTVTTYDVHCREETMTYPSGLVETTAYVNLGSPTDQFVQKSRPAGSTLAGSGFNIDREYLNGYGEVYKSTASGKLSATSDTRVVLSNFDKRGNLNWQTIPLTWGEATNATSQPNDKKTRFFYDVLGREVNRYQPNGARSNVRYYLSNYAVPGAGTFLHPTIKTKDARCYDGVSETVCGHSWSVLDARGNQIQMQLADYSGSDVDGTSSARRTKYRYDLLNRLIGVTDPNGATWTYTYDTFGNRLTSDDPALGAWTMAYDLNNNLVSQQDAKGQTIAFTYDELDRIASKLVTWLDGSGATQSDPTTYTYHEAHVDLQGGKNVGKLTTAWNPEHLVRYGYDDTGQVVEEEHSVESPSLQTYSFLRDYYENGALRRAWLPSGTAGQTTVTPNHIYDAAGRLHSVAGWIDAITYDQRSQPTLLEFDNGMEEVRTYDAERGWVLDINARNSQGTPQYRSIYTRSVAGRVLRHQINAVNEESQQYCYDYAGRLTVAADLIGANRTCETIGNWTGNTPYDQFFSYRRDGSMASNSEVGTYNYAGSPVPHAPASTNGTTLTYDANGNMETGYDGKVLTYDGENRPVLVTKGGITTQYIYGADGTRLQKIIDDSGTITRTVYVGNVEIREPTTPNQKILQYPHENIRIVDGTVSYMFRDQLGSVRLISNQNEMRGERSYYKPFGEKVETVFAASDGLETKGWIGERFDAEAGLQYLNARYYDPELGLFIQPDWFEVTDSGVGANRYSYSFNDPININDPGGNRVVGPEESEEGEANQAERQKRQNSIREAGPAGLLGKGIKAIADGTSQRKARRALRYARQNAVADAWKMERQLAKKGLPTTRDWTPAELTELVDTGRVKGYVGDHINTVNGNVSLAADHRNIQFSTVLEHKSRHSAVGGFRTPISGQPMIDRTLGGQLTDLATPAARGWPSRALDLGLLGISGLAAGLETLDQIDPIFGPNGVFGASPMECSTLDC